MAEKTIALITGANKGIGLETARQLGAQGMTVLIGARDVAKGEQAAAVLKGEGITAYPIPLDVTDTASIAAAARNVEAQFGKLDILINNAGVYPDGGMPVSHLSDDQWGQAFETNVFGLIRTSQAFLPLLRKSESGRIVNLTSILGSLTLSADPKSPVGGYTGTGAAYAVSKAAVNMYTVHLAAELKDTPIKVNAAHPGWVKTDMGGGAAPMEIVDGAKTSVHLATLPADGPTGSYTHLGDTLPW
ncbi:MAG: SDR family oxidoreductase [Cytophagales bacterium]|nr:SDR family oxidoreductase [Armatimonadota bacterium]